MNIVDKKQLFNKKQLNYYYNNKQIYKDYYQKNKERIRIYNNIYKKNHYIKVRDKKKSSSIVHNEFKITYGSFTVYFD
jgi:hypothetical protein